MFTNFTKIPIKLGILLVGFGLLVAGCDSTGPVANEQDEETEEYWTVTNDLEDRVTAVDGNGSSNAVTTSAKAATNFEVTHNVNPPDVNSNNNNDERASHLALSDPNAEDRNLYIGYKLRGSDYGGGIDILDAPDGPSAGLGQATDAGNAGNAQSLQTDQLDVQELAVREEGGNPHALFAATGVQPGNTGRPPQLHSIEVGHDDGLPEASPVYDWEQLENPGGTSSNVAKSVVNVNGGNAWAVSDEESFHVINPSSNGDNGRTIDLANTVTEPGAQFRSVTRAESNGNIYALSDNGSIYEYDGSWNSSPVATLSSADPSDLSIARLTSHQIGGRQLLFVALNDNGFRVYNVDGGVDDVVYSDPDRVATSVTATDDYVYVASGDGFGFYEVDNPSGLGNTNTDDGLSEITHVSIDDLARGSATGAQVNHILATTATNGDIVLYVAKAEDGVYRIQETDGPW